MKDNNVKTIFEKKDCFSWGVEDDLRGLFLHSKWLFHKEYIKHCINLAFYSVFKEHLNIKVERKKDDTKQNNK